MSFFTTLFGSYDLRCRFFNGIAQDLQPGMLIILYDIARGKRLEMSNVYDTAWENRLEVSFVCSFPFWRFFWIRPKLVVLGLYSIHDPHKCAKGVAVDTKFVRVHN